MRSRRRAVAASLVLSLTALGIGFVPPANAADGAKLKIKQRIAKLQVDVAGYVETRELHDTTSTCFPGRRYIQTNRFAFETGNYVNVSVKSISVPGRGTVMTSTFSKAVGVAKTAGKISEYATTNYCPPAPSPDPGPPACATNGGKLAVALTPGDEPADDGDLAPLAGRPLMLSIARRGGGTQPLACAGQGAGSVRGTDTKVAVITTSLAPGVSGVFPARLDAVRIFNLRAHKRVRRVIVAQGACSSVRVVVLDPPGSTPDPARLNADGDCRLIAKVVLTVRARPS
jgi:hypothetical protein